MLGASALTVTTIVIVVGLQTWRLRATIDEIRALGGSVKWESPAWIQSWTQQKPFPWCVTYRQVHLSYTAVDDAAFRRYMGVLDGFRDVERIGLSSTGLSESTLSDLGTLPSLTQLDLDGTHTSDAALKQICAITTLEELSITNTNVTDAGVVHLKRLPRLAVLSLDGTLVSDASAENLAGIRTLEVISLSNTQMTDEGVTVLQSRFPLLDLTDD